MKPSDRKRPVPIPINDPSEARSNVSYIIEKPVKPSGRKEHADG